MRFTKTYTGVSHENREVQTFKKGKEGEREKNREKEGREGTTLAHIRKKILYERISFGNPLHSSTSMFKT